MSTYPLVLPVLLPLQEFNEVNKHQLHREQRNMWSKINSEILV